MKTFHLMLMGFVLALLAATACAQSPQNNHAASVRLTHTWVVTSDDDGAPLKRWEHWIGYCTGTKLSAHVIVTDEHCLENMPAHYGRMSVNGEWGHVMRVWKDDHDHVLMAMDLTFKGPFVMMSHDPVRQGDSIYWYGNPDGLLDMLRRGYVSGFLFDDDKTIVLDANGYKGDSGSAVFNEYGEMIATINQIHSYDFHLMYAFPLRFTAAQYAEAMAWPKPEAKMTATIASID